MSRIFISAAHKSSGKTTVSIGLCAALTRTGKTVQPYKKGPDYIDPYWLSQASGRSCYNLDFYTMQHDEITDLFARTSTGADISIIEGNKGLYDGLDLDGSNSNAALATLTKTPVILVLNARGMTRGIAPLILGYQAFDKEVSIQGVILNQLGGSRHESKLRAVIEHYTDVKVVGAIHTDKRFDIDERHLGLVPGHEDLQCQQKVELLADAVQDQVDLDAVMAISRSAPDIDATWTDMSHTPPRATIEADIRLGLVRSPAFGFYYPDDLEALQAAGASIVEIDPEIDTELPDIDALFIGGGFPETHMQQLEANTSMRKSIRAAIEDGLPAYAECGGLMYLAKSIEWNDDRCEMVGAIDADIIMEQRPQGRGYVQLQETGNNLWPDPPAGTLYAHEFHYSRLKSVDKAVKFAFDVKRGTGIDGQHDGYIYRNLLANYTHQRNTRSNPWAVRFINFARSCKKQDN